MSKSKFNAQKFLIVCFRYIGDVLVTTPLALSLKTAFPDAIIDYLVFEGTDKAIAKNPLIRNIITVPKNKSNLGTLVKLFRSYDVAFAANASDRTSIAAAITGKRSIGLTYRRKNEYWKNFVLDATCFCDDRTHIVSVMLALAVEFGIPPVPLVVMSYDEDDVVYVQNAISNEKYMLLHPYSLKQYKYWPAKSWGILASLIQENTGCRVVFTATPSPDDNTFLEEIMKFAPKNTMTFPCSLTQFAAALKRCTAYIGIDTAATHIAAALEVPTIALFGSSWTRYWAPWPNGSEEPSPFAENKGIQRKAYVTVVQKDWDCVPCNGENCIISNRGRTECMEAISPEEVVDEIIKLMGKK